MNNQTDNETIGIKDQLQADPNSFSISKVHAFLKNQSSPEVPIVIFVLILNSNFSASPL
jgi:hypothetical protein